MATFDKNVGITMNYLAQFLEQTNTELRVAFDTGEWEARLLYGSGHKVWSAWGRDLSEAIELAISKFHMDGL